MTSITHDMDFAAGDIPTTTHRWLVYISIISMIAVIIGLALALFYAGTDRVQGDVQRIFYLHLPVFFAAAIAFAGATVMSIATILRRQAYWDGLTVSLVEVGLMFTVVTVVTGSIWARPIWNTWWTESPRLVSTLITGMIYVGYLLMRDGIRDENKRRIFSVSYLLVAFALVVYTIIIARLREDGIHPTVIGNSGNNETMAMSDSMRTTLIVNIMIWAGLVMPTIAAWRARLQTLRRSSPLLG